MTLAACGGDDDNTAPVDDYPDVINPGTGGGGDKQTDPVNSDDGTDDVPAPTPPPVGGVPLDPPVQEEKNRPPSISGKPSPQVVSGASYSFKPAAVDPDMDAITFSVENLPVWATFDPTTGRLTGTPTAADQGIYSDITISVSDGERTVSLSPFSIEVVAYGIGSATLNWVAPTMRTDGTTLDNLAGYRIYWGTSIGDYTESATIDNPGVTTYVVEGLVPATYYFVATAYDEGGLESQFSGVASKTIE